MKSKREIQDKKSALLEALFKDNGIFFNIDYSYVDSDLDNISLVDIHGHELLDLKEHTR